MNDNITVNASAVQEAIGRCQTLLQDAEQQAKDVSGAMTSLVEAGAGDLLATSEEYNAFAASLRNQAVEAVTSLQQRMSGNVDDTMGLDQQFKGLFQF
jgi:myo-inositol-hexaphosphate 3-phosphohydrolase